MVEIALRAGLDAVGADAGLGDVEIDLHDPPLAPDGLDQHGEPGLEPLAEIAAALPQEHVLGGLLADRRAAADAAALGVALDRLLDRLAVEAVMARRTCRPRRRSRRGPCCGRSCSSGIPVRGDAVAVEQSPSWVEGHRRGHEPVSTTKRQADDDEPAGSSDDPPIRRRMMPRFACGVCLRRVRQSLSVPVRAAVRRGAVRSMVRGLRSRYSTTYGNPPHELHSTGRIGSSQPAAAAFAGDALHRLLQLLERAHLDLADAFAADVIDLATAPRASWDRRSGGARSGCASRAR